MGLAASQARLIALTARMSDLEYEGQQINQQRQTLTNKMTEVYNKAMDMPVPTPPSKIDFAQEAYSGRTGGHDVEFRRDEAGRWYGYEVKEAYTSEATDYNTKHETLVNLAKGTVLEDKQIEQLKAAGYNFDLADGCIADESQGIGYDGTSGRFYVTAENGIPITTVTYNIDGDDVSGVKVDYAKATEKYGDVDNFKNGLKGLKNALGEKFDESKITGVIRLDGGSFKFLYTVSNNGSSKTQEYNAFLDAKAHSVISDIEAQFDPGTTNIKGFSYTNADGVRVPVNVTATGNAYNEVEYDAAYRQYELDKIDYDQKQNEFNKQTSIYQRQDKQLELKLTRLDNERNALKTEIDAVKKVIQDGTETGFKTFSG